MAKDRLKKRIDVAAKRIPADTVIKNCKIVNVYSHEIINGDIAISDGKIAAIGSYEGKEEIDAKGNYALPGFINSHIHIESSFVSPEEFIRLVVPHGTTTIIADPHEIVNVCGIDGLDYMINAAENAVLNIKYMLPSCVPCTPWEHSGAVVDTEAMKSVIKDEKVFGLGEFMNTVGVVNTDSDVLDKIELCHKAGKLIDGHSPGLTGDELSAYITAGIHTDHESGSVEELQERLRNGMYVMLRYGSACKELPMLLKGVTEQNARRCVLCADDLQPVTIFEKGDIDEKLRICVANGIDPITAVQMATLNATECFEMRDRGAIAPNKKADILLVNDLENFKIEKVFIEGKIVAENGTYLPEVKHIDTQKVAGSVRVKDFSTEKLKLNLKTEKANVIRIIPGSVVTKKEVTAVDRTDDGDFRFNKEIDVAKIAVIERHQMTGNVATALIAGYGIKAGAIAITVAHDSHNIIVVGTTNEDMAFAVSKIIEQEGGVVVVNNGEVLESMPLPIAGLMSDRSGEWVKDKLIKIHDKAYNELGVSHEVEPTMTLCFMALPVIPEVKITDMGLFDVTKQEFINMEAEKN